MLAAITEQLPVSVRTRQRQPHAVMGRDDARAGRL